MLSMVIKMERYERIQALRKDLDLTQESVGKAINVPQRTPTPIMKVGPPQVLCALKDFYILNVTYIRGQTYNKKTNR